MSTTLQQEQQKTNGSVSPAPQVQVLDDGPLAIFEKPRLPWHPAIEDRFGDCGVTRATWKTLVEAIWPRARTVDSVVMALAYCKHRQLDPFKRVVHIVPVWDSGAGGDDEDGRPKGGYIETVWPGIAELRTTAFRTGQYAGCDDTVFGPMVTKAFKGAYGSGQKRRDIEKTVTFPEWAQIAIYRMVHGQPIRFAGPKVYWLETYASIGPTDVPNEMWAERASGQIEKCAEAASLRKTFPEELGSEYAAEEMEGRRWLSSERLQGPAKRPALEAPPPPGFGAAKAITQADKKPDTPAAQTPAKTEPPAQAATGQEAAKKPAASEAKTADKSTEKAAKNGAAKPAKLAAKPASEAPAQQQDAPAQQAPDDGDAKPDISTDTPKPAFEERYLTGLEERTAKMTTAQEVVEEMDAHMGVENLLSAAGKQRALGILYARQSQLRAA